MPSNFSLRLKFVLLNFSAVVFAALLATTPLQAQDSAKSSPAAPGLLTVDRIYGQPSLSGHLSRAVAWTPDNKKLTYFETTGSGKDARTSLWAIDLSSGERSMLIAADKLEAILPAKAAGAPQAAGSGRHAPAEYRWAPNGDALLFAGPNSLVWFDLKSQSGRVLVSGKEELADSKVSPDAKFVSFIRDHNLWLVDIADGKVHELTTGGTEEVRKGELDWVYPEELEITTAYWWAPDSSAIAYLQMDESKVSQFSLVDFESFTGEANLQRYPVGGGANPTVHVYVAPLSGGKPRVLDTGENNDIYIPRVNWLPDSKRIAVQRLNRTQTTLELLLADASTGKSSVLLTEKDAYWINLSDILYFFKDGKRFLWSSERTGYRHLYLYDMSGKQLAQLTTGDWEVTRVSAVDDPKGLVYYVSTEKTPLERHLYRVSLDGSAATRLTKEDGTHAIQFAPDASTYLDTYSNSATPPRQDVYRADGTKAATVNENKIAELAGYHLSPVEFFTVKSHDDVVLNCFMIKPPNFDPSKKYPVITFTYGGPHAQVVVNGWGGSNYLWHQLMAQKGFIIFALDNRGSAGRGHVFEEFIHYRFGAQELSDQRDGAVWLRHQPYVDPDRIGIWGWSYGGHMTLHAIFEAPETYKVAFAGAPVTDWHFYDSIYTERYIGLPDEVHEESYQESSPVQTADGLKGKLLIAHGTGDDNVHYSNTLALLDELIKHGKYVEVISAPGRGHPISDPPARRIVFTRVTQFFLDNL
jgi:dipeptidyl-peptidase-4